MEAQQQALAAVESVVQGLSPEQQLELRNQLDQVLRCVASLRSEVAELRGGLQDIALQIIQDVKWVEFRANLTFYRSLKFTERRTFCVAVSSVLLRTEHYVSCTSQWN